MLNKPSEEWANKLAATANWMMDMQQVECPLTHYFAPGIYVREIFMPADTNIIGKIHKTEHLNVVLQGRVAVIHEGGAFDVITAPYTFTSKAGVGKALYIYEDCVWQTIHATDLRDINALEELLWAPHPEFDYPPQKESERLGIEQAAQAETKLLEHAT